MGQSRIMWNFHIVWKRDPFPLLYLPITPLCFHLCGYGEVVVTCLIFCDENIQLKSDRRRCSMGFRSEREKMQRGNLEKVYVSTSLCNMDCSTEEKTNPRLLPIKSQHDNIKQFIRLSQWHLLCEKASSN